MTETIAAGGVPGRKKEILRLLRVMGITLALLAAAFFLTGVILKYNAKQAAKTAMIQLAVVFLPGMAAYTFVSDKDRPKDLLSILTYGVFLGFCFNVVSYFLLAAAGQLRLARWWSYAACAASAVLICARRNWIRIACFRRRDLPAWALFLVYAVLVFLAYSAKNAPPFTAGVNGYHQDLLYWLENASALTRGYPPVDPRVNVGKVFYYHFFSSIQIAYTALSGGTSVFSLGVSYFWVFKSILVFGSVYLALERYPDGARLAGMISLLFCTGFEDISLINYCSHLWLNPFGFDIGFAFGILFLCFMLQQDEEAFRGSVYFLTVLTFGMCTGSKAPVALVLLAAAGVICLRWLIRKEYKKAFVYGISLVTVFTVIMVFCVGVFQKNWSGNGTQIGFRGFDRLVQVLFLSHPLIAFLVLAGLIPGAIRRQLDLTDTALLISYLFGAGLGIFVIHDGASEMYYVMAACIPGILFAYRTLSKTWETITGKPVRWAVLAVAGILLCTGCCRMLFSGEKKSLAACTDTGFRVAAGTFDDPKPEGYRVTASDYQALEWIRRNTPADSVVLSDKAVISRSERYMCYGTFSERQAYIEGDGYYRQGFLEERERRRDVVRRVLKNDPDAIREAKADGVQYIVHTLNVTRKFKPDETLLEAVYQSQSIYVYRIR